MAREKADYRPILEDILDFMEERHGVRCRLLTIADVMAYTGKSRNTVVKLYSTRDGYIHATSLAMRLCSVEAS